MSGSKLNGQAERAIDRARQAAERVKPVAAQMKPLAETTRETARRGVHRTRAWAAPQLERTGHILEESVAPKVSAMMSSAAKRIEPEKPRRRRWAAVLSISASTLAAGAAAAAAVRLRMKSQKEDASDTPEANGQDPDQQ